jgi:hypothetical protein
MLVEGVLEAVRVEYVDPRRRSRDRRRGCSAVGNDSSVQAKRI